MQATGTLRVRVYTSQAQIPLEGATVVVVTHEENIAEFTERIIRFQDGQIISDIRRGEGQ